MASAPQAAPRLAARCPNCQTAFRVVADQLRLRGGLVRCGRCNHVFDGRAHLIELGATPTPPAATPVTPAPQQADSRVPAVGTAPAPVPAEPSTPPTEAPAEASPATPTAEDDHGFGMTLIWEEDVAEVHLGEVEGATPIPDAHSTAPDTRPLADEARTEAEAEVEAADEPAPAAIEPAADVPTAAPAAAPSKKGMQFGKGIYDSMNRELEAMISESMNINISTSTEGSPSVSVSATDEDAATLAGILKAAGIGASLQGTQPDSHCPTCGQDIDEHYKKEAIDKNNDKSKELNDGLEKLADEYKSSKLSITVLMSR